MALRRPTTPRQRPKRKPPKTPVSRVGKAPTKPKRSPFSGAVELQQQANRRRRAFGHR